MNLTYGQKSDVGRVRSANQDNLTIAEAEALGGTADGLFVVADGMGGHAGGETASRITIETVPLAVREALCEPGAADDPSALEAAVREALIAANAAVYRYANDHPDVRGMGTTCVAALVRGDTAVVGNVGDSRIYLYRSGELRQLTEDHSLVQEYVRQGEMTAAQARESRFRNVITRAIGIAEDVEPDVEAIRLIEGDAILLCSDGLHGMMTDDEICDVLASADTAQDACDVLIEGANRNGGEDNVSAVVMRYGAPVPHPPVHREMPVLDEAFDFGAAEPAAPAGHASPWLLGAVVGLLIAVIVLSSMLAAVGRGGYELAGSWPLLRPRKVAAAPPPAPAQPDFGSLNYAAPVVTQKGPFRGAPVACDPAGNTFVTTAAGRIVRVAPDGAVDGEFPASQTAARASGATQWATDGQGYLYVSSRADRCVYKYRSNGTRVAVIGRGQLTAPEGLGVDGAGNIHVVDNKMLKVLRAASGGSVGAR